QTYSVQPVGVTAKFFDVLQVAVVRGRSFSAAEEEAAAPVVIVSAYTAAALWPNMDPVGLRLWLEQAGGTYSPVQVIGVVRDLFPDMRERPPRDVYLPYRYEATRFPHYSAILLARGPGLPQELGRRLLAQVTSEEPQVGLSAIRSMDDEVRGDAGSADLLSRLLAALGLIGLVLAITGLYGLTAFLATQRRREFGIRKALGATNLWLSTMVAVEGFPPLLKGAGLGAGMAVFIGYWLRARSFPTLAPFDWLALLVVSALLPLVGMVGTVLPFRRMLRAEASQMLRED
ncbi:MAG: FtsX-like permease family protein, partial [Acidobacteriota bacterium]